MLPCGVHILLDDFPGIRLPSSYFFIKTIESIVTYFKGVKSEWSKIIWPEKNQVIAETAFVVAIVAIFTISVYLIDLVFKGLLGLIPIK